jgi:hypothetical protein
MRRALLIAGLTVVVLLGVLLLVVEVFADHRRRFTGDLSRTLPPSIAGWVRRDVPVAVGSAAAANVQGILNYSQVGQAVYAKDGLQLLVYVAYWEPGKVSVVDAGSHNPDSCWVNNGCTRTDRRHAVSVQVAGRALLPYEAGSYLVPRGGLQHVAFWHLVNGEPNRYEDQQEGWRDGLVGRLERLPFLLKDIRAHGFNQKSEQMFIRFSSPTPWSELFARPDVQALLRECEALGLFADRPWK